MAFAAKDVTRLLRKDFAIASAAIPSESATIIRFFLLDSNRSRTTMRPIAPAPPRNHKTGVGVFFLIPSGLAVR